MPAALLPLLTAVAFAVGTVRAWLAEPVSRYGEAYAHVPLHLVPAAAALLVALAVLPLVAAAATSRARRAARWCAAGWLLTAAVFALEAYGATIDDGYGENSVHGAAVLALVPAALVLLVTAVLVLVTRGRAVPWPLALVLLVSIPAAPALGEAHDRFALAVGLLAAAGWAGVAVAVARPARQPVAA